MSALSRAAKARQAKRAGQLLTIPGCDWAWTPPMWSEQAPTPLLERPQSGARMNIGTTLHHDAETPDLILRQTDDLSLHIMCGGFDGTYLSIATDLAPSVVKGLTRNHILTAHLSMICADPLPVFARLNMRQGPNVVQMSREVTGTAMAFDLAYSNLNEARVEKLWLDLIFDRPAMAEILLTDLRFERTLRLPL